MSKYVITKLNYELFEENHADGEGKFINSWNERPNLKQYDSVKDLLNDIQYVDCDAMDLSIQDIFECDPLREHDYGYFEGMIIVNLYGTDGDIIRPDEEDIEEWMNDARMLYGLRISVHIAKIEDLTKEDASEMILLDNH